MVEREKKEGECPAIPTPRPPPQQQRQPESPQRHTGTGREHPPPGRPSPPPRPGPAGPPQGPQSQRAGRHGGKESAAPAQPGEQPPRRAGRTQRRAPPEKDAHSPRRAPHHHPGVPGIPPPQPQVRARTPQGRPAPHSRQPSARPTVGPGRSKAGARRPRPGGGNPGEKRGPTRGVVNMARPGSATVGNLAGPKISSKMTNKVCKLFIGGLCVNTNDDGLRKHFEQFGTLTDFVVLQNKNAQRSRCFGFVTYSTPEEANAAMAAAPHTVEGNSVEVKRAIPKAKDNKSEAPAKGEKIFVGGLKNNIEEYHLTDYFSWYGPKETGKKRGFGFVHFTHHKTADLALVEKYHTVNGHLVEVKKAVARQEMQAGNRTETTPRHRPGQCMMENQNGYCGLASSGPQHHRHLQ
uniref:RRM domain-containing protein n=1 Tax=Oryzias latipes TaxID=8090 RepID=A0A3P9LKF7_ORYLA